MARFQITLNMGSKSGANVHQIIVDHEAKDLQEFRAACKSDDFIIIDEIYKRDLDDHNRRLPRDKWTYEPQGEQMINTFLIGRAKPYRE